MVHDELQKEADEDVMVNQPLKEAEESVDSAVEEEKSEVVTVW